MQTEDSVYNRIIYSIYESILKSEISPGQAWDSTGIRIHYQANRSTISRVEQRLEAKGVLIKRKDGFVFTESREVKKEIQEVLLGKISQEFFQKISQWHISPQDAIRFLMQQGGIIHETAQG